MAGCCRHGDEPSGHMKHQECLGQQNDVASEDGPCFMELGSGDLPHSERCFSVHVVIMLKAQQSEGMFLKQAVRGKTYDRRFS